MARWPMAALLASVAPIGRHQSDVRGMPPASEQPREERNLDNFLLLCCQHIITPPGLLQTLL